MALYIEVKSMINKIKQLLCDHKYIAYLDPNPFFVSLGDEYNNRKSKRYSLTCVKCNKEIEIIDRWNNDEIRKNLMKGDVINEN
jgi:hypothetical protein